MKFLRILTVIALAVCFILPIKAEETTEISSELYQIDEFDTDSVLDALPDEVRARLPNGNPFAPEGFSAAFSAEYFFNLIKNALSAALSPALKNLSMTLGLILIASALSALKGMLRSDSLVSLFEFISGLCIILTLYTTAISLAETVHEYLQRLSAVVGAMVPVMIAISTAGGNIGTAAVSANGMMLALAFVEILTSQVLFPILQLCFGLAVASGIGGTLKLGGISKLVRGVLVWVIALISAIISAVMTFQTSIAARADSLSMRAIKFAASNTVPVVGGIASDAVGAVASSLSLIKGTFGWVGVIIIAVMTLPVILNILLTRLGVSISETAADVIGLDKEKSLLTEMCGLLGFLGAVCVIAALMFVYALALFAKSVPALV
ncbi:MAG: hypothetical protein IJF48_01420 [Clostridia bacterium]|nr:hypothetical protein [Clostridia bacterium]